MKALVFGATGTVGTHLVRLLEEAAIPLHALSRSPKADDPSQSSRWLSYDLADGGGKDEIWEGVDRVFLLSPPGYADQFATLAPVIDAATARQVQKLVLMTAWGVDQAIGSPFHKAEAHLKASGLPYTILRPNWFMQNHLSFWAHGIKQEGVLYVPGGDAKASFIDARDIAAVAAKSLVTPGNQELALSGPQALSHAETADILSRALARPIRYEAADEAAFAETLEAAGLPGDYVKLLLVLFSLLRQGLNAPILTAVKDVTGREPRTFQEFAAEHAAALL